MLNGTALPAERPGRPGPRALTADDPLPGPNGRYLVGFDGSASSREALSWAAARARDAARELVLVGVVDRDGGPVGSEYARDRGGELEPLLARHADALRDGERDFAVSAQLTGGDVAGALARIAEDGDVLVVGSDKTGFAQGRVFGARSIQLVAAARTCVVVIPSADLRLRRGVVVGLPDAPRGERLVRLAAREAGRSGQPLLIVRAAPAGPPGTDGQPDGVLLDEARRIAMGETRGPVTAHLVHRRPAEAILNLSRECVLLVVGRSYVDAPIGVGRTLHDLLMNANVPTVVGI